MDRKIELRNIVENPMTPLSRALRPECIYTFSSVRVCILLGRFLSPSNHRARMICVNRVFIKHPPVRLVNNCIHLFNRISRYTTRKLTLIVDFIFLLHFFFNVSSFARVRRGLGCFRYNAGAGSIRWYWTDETHFSGTYRFSGTSTRLPADTRGIHPWK